MTQATVNVGNSAVKSLNPNAQQFSSSEFNHGTVLAGSTAPSDDTYVDYLDNGSGSYLTQHPPHVYQVDPSSIDTSASQQQQQQQQANESNFSAHEHVPMLDTIEHQQPSTPSSVSSSTTAAAVLLNPTHPHHPQSHIRQTMPDDEQVHQLTPEQLRQSLRKQLEYYFSRENMVNDRYLKSKMDAEDYVSIATIADFNLVKRMTHDLQLITDVLKELPSVEVDSEGKKVRSTEDKKYPIRKRCIIILRDVPLDATETEVSDLFINEHCPVPAVACEKALESGTSGCWYITFNSEDDAQNAFLYLTRENVSIRGQKVLARMKARLWQKPSSVPSTHPTTPVSPPITNNNGGATSPPPPPSAQQSMLAYPNPAFVPQQQQQQQQQQPQQQQQQQQPPPPQPQQGPPQYSTHPQQFNQQQIPPQQQQQPPPQQHGSFYMQTTGNTHPNQAAIHGNLQGPTGNYRHPIQSPMPPPPTQHVSAQFSSTNPTQHPTSMEHAQVLQPHLRMSYPSYGANSPFDRSGWPSPHQQNVQTAQPTFSYATAPQAANMASYPASMHQPGQFIPSNNPFIHNVFYLPSTYQTTEPYSTMSYNGGNKPKNRIPRDNFVPSKSRNSTKPPGARNSRHEGLPISNEHSNELLDYCQHSTPHSEGSSSPVPRAEVVLNRSNEPLVQQSLPHVQTYPANTNEALPSDNVEHYHHLPSANEILYNTNNSNSHLQQQTSTETSSSQEQSNVNQSFDNSKLTHQPLEQRKPPSINQDSQVHSTINENQAQSNNKKPNSQPASIRPLMPRENRSQPNSNRPNSSSNQQGRSQQQQQQRMNSNSSAPLSVTIPKVSSATYYNQTSTSSPQSPTSNQKTQQLVNDNNGPRTYADMLKQKQAPQQQQQQNDSTKSPPNESNDLSSSRAQSPSVNNPKTDSNLVNTDVNGPVSSSSSDLSPANRIEPANNPPPPPSASNNNDNNSTRRNSSASDHPQQQQQQQQHSSSPSHQQYNNSRGRGRGGNYRYSNNERRSGSNNSLNRGGGGGGGGGRGGNRRSMNNNNGGPNGPSGYQPRGRGNGRFFDRSRGGGGNYHNSNQTVHRFTGNPGNVEPQAHFAE